MKSSHSNINSWSDSFLTLASRNKPSQSMLKLYDAGIKSIYDLLWITPLRLQKQPTLKPFALMQEDELFLGEAKVINYKLSPAYGRKGRGRVQLFNALVTVQDVHSPAITNLRWFNTYPSFKKQIEATETFIFLGTPNEFKGELQIVNPKINPKLKSNESGLLVEYPTYNTVPGNQISKIIEKIPTTLWKTKINSISNPFAHKLSLSDLENAFAVLHGRSTKLSKTNALNRIIYEEFFQNQLKVLARKLKNKSLKAQSYDTDESKLSELISLFPYELTKDQLNSVQAIVNDLKIGHPMMRMIQGDVGCGKTTVAIIAMMMMYQNGVQSALMCPTETLAYQHFNNIKSIIPKEMRCEILLGGMKTKEKKQLLTQLKNGDIDFLIGTHSLFQEGVEFKNLQLAIIDEQHKFGVGQRQKLIDKGHNVHTLIMTATPIPRSLQLAQYGDLDISTIRTMPRNRKGINTRIVTSETYEKYLSFIKTRVELGEQVYLIVPAIEESVSDLKTVDELVKQYKKYFPEFSIQGLHGQIKNEDKQIIMDSFSENKINILIATTVIEVGIDVKNATVMSIYNPERFGLSSLHQLRGRVGRGGKPGFCFLITEKNTPKDSLTRLKVIEKSSDGFDIAEADLKMRGQGDLFGSSQSGHLSEYRFANVFQHFEIFEKVGQDLEMIKKEQTELLNNKLLELIEDSKVSSTI